MPYLKSLLSAPNPITQFFSSTGNSFSASISASASSKASANTVSNNIMLLLVLIIILLLIVIILLACTFVHYHRLTSRNFSNNLNDLTDAVSVNVEPKPQKRIINKKITRMLIAKWVSLFLGLLASSSITTVIKMRGQPLGAIPTVLIFVICLLPYLSVRQKYNNRKHLEDSLKD